MWNISVPPKIAAKNRKRPKRVQRFEYLTSYPYKKIFKSKPRERKSKFQHDIITAKENSPRQTPGKEITSLQTTIQKIKNGIAIYAENQERIGSNV